MICAGCGKEVGKLYCGHCRKKIKKKTVVESKELIPLLYWDEKGKSYRFGCNCLQCPCNHDGICGVLESNTLKMIFDSKRFHEFDGDNIIRQVCG
jgi:hypothetical protein